MFGLTRLRARAETGGLAQEFGLRDMTKVREDVGVLAQHMVKSGGSSLALSTAGLFRPDLSLPAYAGLRRDDGIAPLFSLFGRHGGGRDFRMTVSRRDCIDYRGGRLTYDEHDGTDVVCPSGTPVTAAAPGVLVAVRDTFVRGGLTACVDHGGGVVTQYTHLSRVTVALGAQLRRGETFAVSGTGGLDMITGFPWVPPHVHFMVWVAGRPVDPFLADGEAPGPGTWVRPNEPETSRRRDGDTPPPSLGDLGVDEAGLEQVMAGCRDERVRREVESLPLLAGKVAVIEDSLHHQRFAWEEGLDPSILRLTTADPSLRISLPLPVEEYRTAAAVDAPWTRPRSSST